MKNDDTKNLFNPVKLGSAMAVNGFAVAPMTNQQSSDDGVLSEAESQWLTLRARGGFGTIITGGWAVAPEARVWPGQTALFEDQHLPPLRLLADELRTSSALGIVQLIHGGARYTPGLAGQEGVSASAGEAWRGASAGDIDDLLESHRRSALRVQAAGLSGVEIHAAHGYLPAQFISSTQNRREDAWGGDLRGRARFVRHLTRTIRDATGPDFVVGVRLSAEDEHHGIYLHETATIAGWLADDGVDYIHLSLPDASAASGVDPRRHPLDFIRPKLPSDVAVMVAGGIWTARDAHDAARCGADLVALGQAAIYNPDWPVRAMSALWSPERPPFTRTELAHVGVTRPFATYIEDGWPGSVVDD